MAPATVFLPTLPGRYYTDPEIFEREKRNIFERQWQYVSLMQNIGNLPIAAPSAKKSGRFSTRRAT
jgi:hypothetical protein